jgi:hypothetical protein
MILLPELAPLFSLKPPTNWIFSGTYTSIIFNRYRAFYISCWTAWHEVFRMQFGITELELDSLSCRPYKSPFKNVAISLLSTSDSKSASCFLYFIIIQKGNKILNNTKPHQITIIFSQRLIPKHRHLS